MSHAPDNKLAARSDDFRLVLCGQKILDLSVRVPACYHKKDGVPVRLTTKKASSNFIEIDFTTSFSDHPVTGTVHRLDIFWFAGVILKFGSKF